MILKTINREISKDVELWHECFVDERYKDAAPFWDKYHAHACAMEAIQEKTVDAVNAVRIADGWGKLSIICSVCGEDKPRLIVVADCAEEGDIEICRDCLRKALEMIEEDER